MMIAIKDSDTLEDGDEETLVRYMLCASRSTKSELLLLVFVYSDVRISLFYKCITINI